ncbi:sugar-binding domain-containing protein [Bacillus sp. FJAT-50079]|uniref:sugar-binding transcriptional regulator n=1 Tax=Bacillus sp. FJAT-50079 TaxID=2833577 RepID=UPI001BC9CE88|nr:sugar-binding domain-containing protein [Bacillus sp. FJAT-50079]MBS4208425.1 hypothetical protein [Bacillus sp. FJAT-50079]
MDTILKIQSKIVPDMLVIMQKRYQILRSIFLAQPVGRRTLAEMLGMTERTLRSEVEFFKTQQLIHVKAAGMTITKKGTILLHDLDDMMREIFGIKQLEQNLIEYLAITDVVIVPGDSDETPLVKEELGKACAERLKTSLHTDNIIAVTGGTTMACAAEMLTSDMSAGKRLLFVPARGGIGEDVKNQANVICATMAEKSGGSHRVLYVPDQVGREVYESLLKEPAIKEILQTIKSANIVLHGIGDALTMAGRRRSSAAVMKKVIEENAVGEAFGYYFNENGEIVHKVPTIGIQISDLHSGRQVIAAAGGKSKAKAIKAYMKSAPQNTVLITDEGAARMLLEGTSY